MLQIALSISLLAVSLWAQQPSGTRNTPVTLFGGDEPPHFSANAKVLQNMYNPSYFYMFAANGDAHFAKVVNNSRNTIGEIKTIRAWPKGKRAQACNFNWAYIGNNIWVTPSTVERIEQLIIGTDYTAPPRHYQWLVLDFKADARERVQLSGLNEGVYFDVDGVKDSRGRYPTERVSWPFKTNTEVAFLVHGAWGTDYLRSANEFFSPTATIRAKFPDVTTPWQLLARYLQGRVVREDKKQQYLNAPRPPVASEMQNWEANEKKWFGTLAVWLDKFRNGRAERDEIYKRELLGIKEISFKPTPIPPEQQLDSHGNRYLSRSSFYYQEVEKPGDGQRAKSDEKKKRYQGIVWNISFNTFHLADRVEWEMGWVN